MCLLDYVQIAHFVFWKFGLLNTTNHFKDHKSVVFHLNGYVFFL